MGIFSSIWNGVRTVATAAQAVLGTPGAAPAPSLVSQKPSLAFQRGSVAHGLGARTASGTGQISGVVPYAMRQEPSWMSLQRNYLAYLNMAEAFEEPGKVRRSVKLKVS